MARARNIKPSFFKNELLVEMGPFDRLLFIGLWCLADREGRVEDRPKRIKMELLPCDAYDVDAGLAELARSGFIKRYEAAGVRVISIINFIKHQTPHGTEKDSELPDENGVLTENNRAVNGYVTGFKRKNNVNSSPNNGGPPLSNSAKTVEPVGQNALNPDSLNPDSLNPDSLNKHAQPLVGEGDGPVGPARASPAGIVCLAIRAQGIADANPSHPDLLALLDAGAGVDVFIDAAVQAAAKGKGFRYVLGTVKGRMADAAKTAATELAKPSTNSRFGGSEPKHAAAAAAMFDGMFDKQFSGETFDA